MSTIAHDYSLRRVLGGSLALLPVATFSSLQYFAKPDLEIWLSNQTKGFCRPGAFHDLHHVLVVFMMAFAVTSVLAMLLILFRKSPFLLPLAAGPLIGVATYLVSYGLTDPAWFALLAITSIGMIVSAPVTVVWLWLNRSSTKHSS